MFGSRVSTLVVEWIEMKEVKQVMENPESPPSWWSGLKLSV